MKYDIYKYVLCMMTLCAVNFSNAQLSVKTDVYGSKPGYIDKATLVVEPHGAYVEQSLYLTYSDHHQFTSSLVEIVHRFELPANAVINDLWLWIGDSVMQAIVLDTWTARSIYDSIVSQKRDPAFLSKSGNKYELHIYPLISGQSRKVKMNFITPVRWEGRNGVAELPLKMLKDNNAQKKPLHILFRESERIWGDPSIKEMPDLLFKQAADTNNYHFREVFLDDITQFTSFNLGFVTNFVEGKFISTSDIKNDATYFQFGFDPGKMFSLKIDSSAKRLLFALDLSGVHNKNFVTLIPSIKKVMRSAVKQNDSVGIAVAGAGKIDLLTKTLVLGNHDTLDALVDRFAASDWGKQVATEKLPHILYADGHAATCWQFPGLGELSTYSSFSSLLIALNNFKAADVIAAYDHGYEHAGETKLYFDSFIAKIDSFFSQGGRFVSYYDYNRAGKELIGAHYIPGLTTTRRPDGSATLYRNPAGNIGIYFPESVVHYGFDYLQYTPDPSVKIELQDKDGKPVVISKKVGNGLIVVSGIWAFRDDGALRGLLGVPLLGLNEVKKNQLLTQLLSEVRSRHSLSQFHSVFVLSNSDSLFQKNDAENWTTSYMNGFGNSKPMVSTINLLDGNGYMPPYLTDNLIQYYGSGYLLKLVSQYAAGRHFETHIDNWPYIISALNAYSYPSADSLSVQLIVDKGEGKLNEMREVDPIPGDANKARFYIGSTTIPNTVQFDVRARYPGDSVGRLSSTTVFVNHDTAGNNIVIPSMLASEKLKDLFRVQVKDTAAIVSLAMRYRLLCDFTAMLALEPNDTIHFMRNPFDESIMDITQLIDESMADSLSLRAYPNPFNNQTNIVVQVNSPSYVEVGIFNMLGQRVAMLAEGQLIQGKNSLFWNGTDNHHRTVSSGVYFVRMVAKESKSGNIVSRVKRILFLK